MEADKIKHLEFIQNIITRMNTNSFQIKTWAITIVSALLGLFASTEEELFIFVALFPAVVFWFIDTYCLMQERKFRGIYNDVSGVTNKNTFQNFAMPLNLYKGGKYSYWNVFTSCTIMGLYLPIIGLLLIVYILISTGVIYV